jgi:transposase, IS5 family
VKRLGLNDSGIVTRLKKTCEARLLAEMNMLAPWPRLVALTEPCFPKPGKGSPLILLETALRAHSLQQWIAHSDPAREESLHDSPPLRELSGPDAGVEALTDETTILKFRHLLEPDSLAGVLLDEITALVLGHGLTLRKGTMFDATVIANSTYGRNAQSKRDPEKSSPKKGNQWYFSIKAHVHVGTGHGVVHMVVGRAATVPDVAVSDALLLEEERETHAAKGYNTKEPSLSVSDPATGPPWCSPFKRRPGNELPGTARELHTCHEFP